VSQRANKKKKKKKKKKRLMQRLQYKKREEIWNLMLLLGRNDTSWVWCRCYRGPIWSCVCVGRKNKKKQREKAYLTLLG